jgi:hypothetical protein
MQIRDDYLLMPVSRTQTIPESQITGRSQKLDAKIHIARLAMAQKKGMGPQGLSFLSAKPSKFGTKTWNHYHTLDGKSSRTVKKFPEGIEGIPGSRLLLDPFGTMAMNHLEKRSVKNPLAIEEI